METLYVANDCKSGNLTMLRVQDVGEGYGSRTPPSSNGGGINMTANWIDADVIVKIDTASGKSFGFQLRNDSQLYVRQGMLSLLKDAFFYDKKVQICYVIEMIRAPSPIGATYVDNGRIYRVILQK